MLSDSPGNLPGFSSPYIIKPKRNKRGRPSGGMFIFNMIIHGKRETTQIKIREKLSAILHVISVHFFVNYKSF
jgi:hypothetical protein